MRAPTVRRYAFRDLTPAVGVKSFYTRKEDDEIRRAKDAKSKEVDAETTGNFDCNQ